MTSVSRYSRFCGSAAWGAWLAAFAVGLYLYGVVRIPKPAPASAKKPHLVAVGTRSGSSLSDADWHVFRNLSAGMPVAGELAAKYRLAGTFLEYRTGGSNRRKAIISSLQSGEESLVSEGDMLEENVDVLRVLHDRVVLRNGNREEQLWLTFSASSAGAQDGSGGGAATLDAMREGMSKFGGKRVGGNRWVFNRQRLLDYYTELMNEPERLVKVFDSLHPLYNDRQEIEGYELRMEGEPEFFDSVGFQEGDIVRSVNKLPMTNRRRAEFFIRQFVEGGASAFVIDIEREGKTLPHTYQVR